MKPSGASLAQVWKSAFQSEYLEPDRFRQSEPSERGDGKLGNWEGTGSKEGQLGSTDGLGGRLNLPEREREALLQSSQSKTPQEYSTLVEQFLKRLSDSRKK